MAALVVLRLKHSWLAFRGRRLATHRRYQLIIQKSKKATILSDNVKQLCQPVVTSEPKSPRRHHDVLNQISKQYRQI